MKDQMVAEIQDNVFLIKDMLIDTSVLRNCIISNQSNTNVIQRTHHQLKLENKFPIDFNRKYNSNTSYVCHNFYCSHKKTFAAGGPAMFVVPLQ